MPKRATAQKIPLLKSIQPTGLKQSQPSGSSNSMGSRNSSGWPEFLVSAAVTGESDSRYLIVPGGSTIPCARALEEAASRSIQNMLSDKKRIRRNGFRNKNRGRGFALRARQSAPRNS